jgi:glycosyltransferase involved in cell wall biosynthesis
MYSNNERNLERTTVSSVSVVVPCYNYARYLPRCVESVLSQEDVDVSVLIIDDASTDDSEQVGRSLASNDPRVEYWRHPVNKGHITTYNEGLDWATGEFTALLSSDDLLVSGALARAAKVMEAHPRVGFVYGRPLIFMDGEPLPRPRSGPGGYRTWSGVEWLEIRCRTADACVASPEVLVRTKVQKEIGGYRHDLPHYGDIEMWLRFAAHSDVGYIVGADQAYYRVHPKSMARQRAVTSLLELQDRKLTFDAVLSGHCEHLLERQRLHDSANRALARDALWSACRAYDRRRLASTNVDELVEFAVSAYPEAPSLLEYKSLQWRRRVGPKVCPVLQPVLVGAALRRIRTWRKWKRVVANGI